MAKKTPSLLPILKKARSLLRYPKRWVQGQYADDILAPKCFCLEGAINIAIGGTAHAYVTGANFDGDQNKLQRRVIRALGFKTDFAVNRWNDVKGRTHAQVLARLDQAIAKLSQ